MCFLNIRIFIPYLKVSVIYEHLRKNNGKRNWACALLQFFFEKKFNSAHSAVCYEARRIKGFVAS